MSKSFNNFNSEKSKVLNAAESGMTKACLKFQADTMALTHIDTGALRRSWTFGVENNNGVVEGAVGSNLEYAPYEDDYHGNLSTALNKNVSSYLKTVADEIKSAVGG